MESKKNAKTKIGFVVSDKMEKTVVVEVPTTFVHKIYSKVITKKKTFKAHDEENKCKVGDKVLIEETRPLSKDKRWKVIQIFA